MQRHVVASEQLRRPAGVLVALRVTPALLGIGRGLRFIIVGNVVEHEPLAVLVAQHAALAAHALRDQDALYARRPNHASGVKLDELHVHQLRACVISERVAVASAFPRIAGDLIGAAQAAGGDHHRLGLKNLEAATFAVVAKRSGDAVAVLQQRHDGPFHVHGDALVDAVILQGADHLQPGTVANVREPGITVPAKITLQDASVLGAIKNRAPGLELVHARGRLLGVMLRHAPVIHVLAAAHRVGKMDSPGIAVIDVTHRRRHTALGHDGVGLAQKRLANQANAHARRRGLDGRAQTRTTRANHQNVVLERLIIRGHRVRK